MCPGKEQELDRIAAKILTEGEMKRVDPEQAALERLIPPHEIRVRAELDPIVEETKRYREMAEEATGRYDEFLDRVKPQSGEEV